MVFKKDYMNGLGRFNPVGVVMDLLSGRRRHVQVANRHQARIVEEMVREQQQRKPLAGIERFSRAAWEDRERQDRHARICTECDTMFTIIRYPESQLEDFCPSCSFRLRVAENKLRRSCKMELLRE